MNPTVSVRSMDGKEPWKPGRERRLEEGREEKEGRMEGGKEGRMEGGREGGKEGGRGRPNRMRHEKKNEAACMGLQQGEKRRGRRAGREPYRVVGSSVAKSRSSASAPACVSRFRSVDFPLLV
jgi:hypothetical protein